MNSNVPNYFIPILSSDYTPYQFMDVIGYCLYKGLSLNFSVNKNTGRYFGYFTNQDNQFINSDCFKFLDLNEYLFAEQNYFNHYIINHKVIVKLNYHRGMNRYQLKIQKEVYNPNTREYNWITVQKVSASKIKATFMKMNRLLINRNNIHHNEKVIEMKFFKHG